MEFAFKMTLTHWIIILTFAGWIFYTANAQKIGQRTISATLRDMGWDWSFFPFAWGALMTHYFAPRHELPFNAWGWGVMSPILLALLAYDLIWRFKKLPRHWVRWPFWYFLLGLPCGYLFWAQKSLDAPF